MDEKIPYYSYERGSNKNFNSLLREFMYKDVSLKKLPTNDLNSYALTDLVWIITERIGRGILIGEGGITSVQSKMLRMSNFRRLKTLNFHKAIDKNCFLF